MRILLLSSFALILVIGCQPEQPAPPSEPVAPQLSSQESGTEALFIGISPVDANTVWISGTGGTYGRTTDGGQTWETAVVPGADSLQFRDVHGVDAQTAFLMSIGPGEQSRIYKTTDAGQNWSLQFTNPEPTGFLDCLDFWDPQTGLAYSDSNEGQMYIVRTDNGGATWTRIPPEDLPAALEGEGGFAASGTCLITQGDQTAFIATGAADPARVLKTTDRGATWTVAETPVVAGTQPAGLMSIAMWDANSGIILGGDLSAPDAHADNIAVTSDGGVTWTLAGRPQFTGAVYGSAVIPDGAGSSVVAVGPKGIDYSTDRGQSWVSLDTLNHWSVAFASAQTGWAVGMGGRITRIGFGGE